MSDHIPLDIQSEIIKRLPVKSVVQCRDKYIAVLWNPSVGKAVSINISNPLPILNGQTFVGFGVCPNTSDPKLVRINTIGFPTVLNWEVEVFTLSTRVWKNRPVHKNELVISKVYESLGLFEYYDEGATSFCDVWIMKEVVTKSFTKMLSIKTPWLDYIVLELRKNGEVIIENMDDTCSSVLEVYEPSSGRSSGVGINRSFASFSVNSYMETLLLLDESNSIIH
ncbi:hypothetical protein Tco_0381072 [Tanacetum coccineum]